MRVRARGAGRLGVYALSTVLVSGANFVAIPLVISAVGADAWASLAVAQSVGTIFSVLVSWGWGISGPAEVARMKPESYYAYYLASLRARSALFLIFALATTATVASLNAEHSPAAPVLAALTLLIWALGGSWLFVGARAAVSLLVWDTVPKVVGTLAGAILVVLHFPIFVFPLTQIVFGLIAVVGPVLFVRQRRDFSDGRANASGRDGILKNLWRQRSSVTIGATAVLYVSLPLVAVGVFDVTATAQFALCDRVVKFGLNALTPIVQMFQGYLHSENRVELAARCQRAAALSAVVGVAGAVSSFAIIEVAVEPLSGSQIHPAVLIVLLLSASYVPIAMSRVVGLACLLALGDVGAVAKSTVAGACLGVISLVLLGPLFGAAGIAGAFLISECAVTAVQLRRLRKRTSVESAR